MPFKDLKVAPLRLEVVSQHDSALNEILKIPPLNNNLVIVVISRLETIYDVFTRIRQNTENTEIIVVKS